MSLVVPGCKEEPPLRVNGRRVHLTYAGLYRDELDHDTILSKARHWGATRNLLREHVIGKEKHTEPAAADRDEHFHLTNAIGRGLSPAPTTLLRPSVLTSGEAAAQGGGCGWPAWAGSGSRSSRYESRSICTRKNIHDSTHPRLESTSPTRVLLDQPQVDSNTLVGSKKSSWLEPPKLTRLELRQLELLISKGSVYGVREVFSYSSTV